jgi:SNF2 family DNA or RNA helicase
MSNEDILQDIEAGRIDRDHIFENYKGLGELVETEGLNFNEKRIKTLSQYFTPYPAIKFVTSALNLERCEQGTFLDNSCGMGRMFRYLPPTAQLVGIELEDNAFKVAKALYPNATLVHGDLIDFVLPRHSVDVSLLNPPFSIWLEKRDSGIINAQWGKLGYRSSVQSHIAALEIALRASSWFVACVVPTAFFMNETTRVFERWIKLNAREVMRIYLPPDIYPNAHVETALLVYDCRSYFYHSPEGEGEFTRTVKTLAELDTVLREWKATEYYQRVITNFPDHINRSLKDKLDLRPREVRAIPKVKEPAIPRYGKPTVRVCLNPVNAGIHLKTDNLLTALKVEEFKVNGYGEVYNKAAQRHLLRWDILAARPSGYYDEKLVPLVVQPLKHIAEVEVDEQVHNVQRNAASWLKRQQAPFEQWVQNDQGLWEEKFRSEGITTKYPALYRQQAKNLQRILFEHPNLQLWDWQKHDIIRVSMKQHAILATDMGLGKTRMGIAAGLLSRCKHILIVTESKLIGQFAGELKQFGCDFKVIERYSDTKWLKRFNLIAYSRLWRKATKGKTFAKALKKQVEYVILDEAHNIKANDSKRALSCRSLHPRHWLLMTGTPIANYPRNIFSLLVCAFGDGTELFRYGYYKPYISEDDPLYGWVTSGTRQFREDFVTISTYISHQFEETLDKGLRRREFPIVKDIQKWHELLAPMMIRRCRDEPEVMREIKIPEPEVHEVWITPSKDHVDYYRLWLDAFAEWFLAELKAEQDGTHKMDMIMLLVQIGKLQFISTIPQSEKVKSDTKVKYNWDGALTPKQEEVIKLAFDYSSQHKKVIVYSERPELQYLLSKELTRRGVRSLVFTGEQPIQKREEILRDFKVRNYSVLLATTSVGGTGLNIPQASVVIFADQSWTPAIHEQAIARVCRPQQTQTPLVLKVFNKGMIDEYMKQMMDVKQEGIKEAIDYQAHTFDPEKWLDFRDMSYRYLKAEGYI